jgi:uncharacterized protein YcbK (DUF882 family)
VGDLTRHFSRSEFACPCGCGFDDISLELVNILDWIREFSMVRMVVTSGCRCESYNKSKGFSKTSSHVKGLAADIACTNARKRGILIATSVNYIQRTGIRKDFIHFDIDKDKPCNVMWLY